MKICWISDSPKLLFVGQARVTREFLSRFKKAGLEVVAIGFNEPKEDSRPVPVDYPVINVHRTEDGINTEQLLKALDEVKPDITVLSHDPFLFWMIDEIKKRTKRLIGYYTIDAEPVPDFWAKAFYLCDDLVIPSKYGRHTVKERFPDSDIHVIPYGVDHQTFIPVDGNTKEEMRKVLNEEFRKQADCFSSLNLNKKFIAIFYGHNQGKKNLLASKLAWEQFARKKDDVLFVLVIHSRLIKTQGWTYVGEFNLKDFIQTKDLILIPTILTDKGLSNLIRSSDVLLAPTIGEGFFCPATECMAAGVIPITTYFAGPTDYLTNDNSFPLYKWVPLPGTFSTIRAGVDPYYLAGRLEDAYKIWKSNPEYWKQMQNNAIKTMESYTWDKATKQFIDLFNIPKANRAWELYRL